MNDERYPMQGAHPKESEEMKMDRAMGQGLSNAVLCSATDKLKEMVKEENHG